VLSSDLKSLGRMTADKRSMGILPMLHGRDARATFIALMGARRRARIVVLLAAALLCAIGAAMARAQAPGVPLVAMEPVGRLEGPPTDAMAQPTDVVVAPLGTIWVLDGVNMRLAAFAKDRRFERYVPLPGFPFENRLPVGLGIEPSGRLLVGDRDQGHILILQADGAFGTTIPIPVAAGERPADPTDLAPSGTGQSLWVVDNDNHCVKEIDLAGRLLRRIGREGEGAGEMRYPSTLALAADGGLAVVDVLNARVDRFDAQGAVLAPIGARGVTPGTFYRPKGIARDRAGRFHVTDSFTGVVRTFGPDGRLIGVWGAKGAPLRLRAPASVFVDDAGLVYVVEMLSNAVTIWREAGR